MRTNKLKSRVFAYIFSRQIRRSKTKIITVLGHSYHTYQADALYKVLSIKYRTLKINNLNSYDELTKQAVTITYSLGIRNILGLIEQFFSKSAYQVIILSINAETAELSHFENIKSDYFMISDLDIISVDSKSMAEIIRERLAWTKTSLTSLINTDYIRDKDIEKYNSSRSTVLTGKHTDNYYKIIEQNIDSMSIDVSVKGKIINQIILLNFDYRVAEVALNSVIVALDLELNISEIRQGLKKIRSRSGYLKPLKAVFEGTIFDGTHNSKVESTVNAIKFVNNIKFKSKILILCDLELEDNKHFDQYFKTIKQLKTSRLKLLVTIGDNANKYFAQYVEDKGDCQVMRFNSPLDISGILMTMIDKDTAVVVKGSKNGIYTEEAIKRLLADFRDAKYLVRQSEVWLIKKKSLLTTPKTKLIK